VSPYNAKKRARSIERRLNGCSTKSWRPSPAPPESGPERLLDALWQAERELWYVSKENVRLRHEINRLRWVLAEVRDYLIDSNGNKAPLTAMEVRWIRKLRRA